MKNKRTTQPFSRRDLLSAGSKTVLVLAAGRTLLAQGGHAETTTNFSLLAFGALETRQSLTPAQIDGVARGLLAQFTLDENISMMSGQASFYEGLLNPGSRVVKVKAPPK